MIRESGIYRIRAYGDFACFTRPELKVERASYPIMTPPAAQGLLDSILWKPAIKWRIHRIHLLKPVEWFRFRRNEVKDKIKPDQINDALNGLYPGSLFIDDSRTQRTTLALKDVDYAIEASFIMTDRAGERDSVLKFHEMMMWRMNRGQYYKSLYLGIREFEARVEWWNGDPAPINYTLPIGQMTLGVWNPDNTTTAKFFEATINQGTLEVPILPHLMVS